MHASKLFVFTSSNFFFSDPKWDKVPKSIKSILKHTAKEDGEFYMSFFDFIKYFGELEICHTTPDSIEATNESKTRFEVFHFDGRWDNKSAGGCGNDGMGNLLT